MMFVQKLSKALSDKYYLVMPSYIMNCPLNLIQVVSLVGLSGKSCAKLDLYCPFFLAENICDFEASLCLLLMHV